MEICLLNVILEKHCSAHLCLRSVRGKRHKWRLNGSFLKSMPPKPFGMTNNLSMLDSSNVNV